MILALPVSNYVKDNLILNSFENEERKKLPIRNNSQEEGLELLGFHSVRKEDC